MHEPAGAGGPRGGGGGGALAQRAAAFQGAEGGAKPAAPGRFLGLAPRLEPTILLNIFGIV